MRPAPAQFPIVLLAWVSAGLCGCNGFGQFGSGQPLRTGVFSPMVHLTDRTPRSNDPLVWDADGRRIRLFAAANETVGFQIVVDAEQQAVRGLRFASSSLSGPGGSSLRAGVVRAFRALPVRVTSYPPWYLRLVDAVPQPVSFYDALVPLPQAAPETAALQLPSRQRLVLWVDVRVPRDAAGLYAGTVSLISESHADWKVPLAVHVHDFVLPDARPIAAVGGIDHRALFRAFVRHDGKPYVPTRLNRKHPRVREGLVIMRQLFRMAHAHRIDLFDKRIRPVLKRDDKGEVRLLWADYDAIVSPYLDGSAFDDRVGSSAWPAPLSHDWPDPQLYGGVDAPRYAQTVRGIARACREHYRSELSASDRVFYWPWRGRVSQGGYKRLARLAELIRDADKDTPVLSNLPLSPPAPTGWRVPEGLAGNVSILAPPADYLDPSTVAGLRRPGRALPGGWLAPGTPPYLPSLGVVATPADVRAVPWFAAKYQCTGLFLPDVLHWTDDLLAGRIGEIALEAGAQTRLFYPGTLAGVAGVLPSIRLKRLRRGLQDLAYVSLLHKRRRGAIADAIVDSMVRYAGLAAVADHYLDPRLGGWVQEATTWQMARRLLAAEVRAAVRGANPGREELLALRLAWRQLEERTLSVVVEQIRSRVVPTADGSRLRVRLLVDLYNQYARSLGVATRFSRLPGDWKALKQEVVLRDFPARTRKVIELSAEGTALPQSGTAKLLLPVMVETDLADTGPVDAPVPFLMAARTDRPPRIDGDLGDWTARPGNCAGGFRLLGRRGRRPDGLAARQTRAFVLYDDEKLYLAVRCDEPNPAGIVAKVDNRLRYQQLMACGEDLVEILLDPGGQAKSCEDLYHLAVKPNGVLVSERGVRTRPPLGRYRPWPAAADVAVGRGKNVWVVEMSIPFTAFGKGGAVSFWRVNFTRFAVQGAEASSWAEAPRYFYDPRNLGTMYVAPRKQARPSG